MLSVSVKLNIRMDMFLVLKCSALWLLNQSNTLGINIKSYIEMLSQMLRQFILSIKRIFPKCLSQALKNILSFMFCNNWIHCNVKNDTVQ